MGLNFKEISVNNIDQKKFEEGYNKIDWGKKKCEECEKEECECEEDDFLTEYSLS